MSPKKIGIHPTRSELNKKEKGLGRYEYQGLIISIIFPQNQAGQEKTLHTLFGIQCSAALMPWRMLATLIQCNAQHLIGANLHLKSTAI